MLNVIVLSSMRILVFSDLKCLTKLFVVAGMTSYPCVPGHELAGVVTKVGRKVTKVKVGDNVGVGCMVDSCRDCMYCKSGEEMFCPSMVSTYGGDPKHGNCLTDAGHTYGGYSAQHTVPER